MNYQDLINCLAGPAAGAVLSQRYPSLTEMARADVRELTLMDGVGEATANRVRAAFQLAEDMGREQLSDKPLLDTPEAVANTMRPITRAGMVESFYVLSLNTRRRLIRINKISGGTLDTLLVHAREVFRPAILDNAAAIVLCHNHPSGDPSPSEADIKVTRDMIRAGQLLKIEVLDHVIMGLPTAERPKDFRSLRELVYFYS